MSRLTPKEKRRSEFLHDLMPPIRTKLSFGPRFTFPWSWIGFLLGISFFFKKTIGSLESGNENSASCRRALQEKLFRKLSQSREIGYHTHDCLIGVLIPHAERPAYAIWSASTRAPGNFGPALVYLIIWFVCVMCPPQLSDSLQRYSVTLSYGIQTLWIFFFFLFSIVLFCSCWVC